MHDINLLPWREERQKYANRRFYALLTLSVLSALLVIFIVKVNLNNNLQQQLKIKNHLIQKINTEHNINNDKNNISSKLNYLLNNYLEQSQTTQLLENIAKSVPDNLVLEQIKRNNQKLIFIGYTKKSSLISKFMDNLALGNYMSNAVLIEVKAKQKNTWFEIEITYKPKEQIN
jgi:type IV pilus assembly protein PilN